MPGRLLEGDRRSSGPQVRMMNDPILNHKSLIIVLPANLLLSLSVNTGRPALAQNSAARQNWALEHFRWQITARPD